MNTIVVIIISLIFTSLLIAICNFLGIPQYAFISYIYWFLALTIFYTILPNQKNNIFIMDD